MPVISALGRWQKDCKFEASLDHSETLSQNEQTKTPPRNTTEKPPPIPMIPTNTVSYTAIYIHICFL
jgi:hypothetical protein